MRFSGFLLVIFGGEKDLPARRVSVDHGNTKDARGKRPKAEKTLDFGAFGHAQSFVGELLGFAEQVFLLHFIEVIDRERGGFDVENECCHEQDREVLKFSRG